MATDNTTPAADVAAIHNANLKEQIAAKTDELQKEQRWLRKGNLILESIVSEATFFETLELIVRFVSEEAKATRCGILLFEDDGHRLRLGAHRDLPEDFDETLLQPPREAPANWIWQSVLTGERGVVNDFSKLDVVNHSDWQSGWVEPIVAGEGKVLGGFVTFREQRGSPSDDEMACVQCACGLARIAIERAHTRAALETSEQRYRTLLERIPAPLFVYDRETLEYLAVSDQAVEEYGYSREEFLQITIADIRPQEDVPALRQMLSESGTEFEHRGVWRHRKKNGDLLDVEITTHGLELAGRPVCIVLAQDVTDRLIATDALRRSEALNQAILQSSLDCIVTMNEAGEIVEFNRAAEQAFGFTREQAVGRFVVDLLIPPELRQKHDQGLARYLLTGEPSILGKRIRTTAVRHGGQTFPVELTVVPVSMDGERLFTAFLRDLTEAHKAEEELHRTTELLQAIADGTTDAVFVKDLQGRYLFFNRAASELTERAVHEVLGQDDIFVFGNQYGRIVMENDWLVMHSNKPHLIEEELVAAGEKRSYQAMKAPLRDTEGNVVGIIGVSRDITERKQAAAKLAELNTTLEQRVVERTRELKLSEQFNRATLDALSAHVAVVNRDGVIVATNAAWRKFARENLGSSQYVSEGSNYLAVCDAAAASGVEDAAQVASVLRDVLAGRRTAWSYEYPCHSPTEQRWFICQVTLGYINQQPHAVTAHENVTSIKLAQQEMQVAKEKAVQASLAKSEFLAAMSHELRTPLNGILGMNALLLRTKLNERQRRFAEACRSSGKVLTQLINDLLDLSKIEAGKLELDPRQSEIEAIIYDVVDILSSAANEKGLTLICRLSQAACVSTLVDDNRLRQILINLVGNAIKFTSTGGVSIRGDLIESSGEEPRLRIEITDTGIGIPQQRIDRLFKAFSQVDSSTTRQFGGTGLGLSICLQLVDLMGGTIGVDSQVGVGSIFWFEVPLENVSQIPKTLISMDRQDGRSAVRSAMPPVSVSLANGLPKLTGHLLVAEDNKINQIYIVELLTLLGCTCDIVESGVAVLSALERSQYNLVLMDCQMPEMDGYTAAREIRLHEAKSNLTHRIPILALTANALKGDRERCLEAGMDDYVKKPIDFEDVSSMLEQYLTPSPLKSTGENS